jgi:hypothetical protein
MPLIGLGGKKSGRSKKWQMQNSKDRILYVLVGLFLSLIGFSCEVHSQSPAKQCKKKTASSDVIACFSDRPCILWLRQNGSKLQIGWDSQRSYDTYIIRWSQAGKKPRQLKLQGGQGGTYELDNISPCVPYSLKIRGCNTRAMNTVRCSRWGTALFSIELNLLI